MKKAILTKMVSNHDASAIKITSPDNNKSKLAYTELFRAVLQIPEKDVQIRILDAVNGKSTMAQIIHAMCPNCKQTFVTETQRKTTATQTDINEVVSVINNQSFRIIALPVDTKPSTPTTTNNDESRDGHSPMLQTTSLVLPEMAIAKPQAAKIFASTTTKTLPHHHTIAQLEKESITTKTNQPMKRKRKRKVCQPQVVMRSHAQMVQKQFEPQLKIIKVEGAKKPVEGSKLQANDTSDLSLFDRRDSIGPVPLDDWMDELFKTSEHKSKEEHIMQIMAEECVRAEERTEGLLPIHHSIVANDFSALRRQIFVWKKLRKVDDLNGLLTDEDETCLQLAIVQDCFPKVIDILINEGLNVNEIDYHSNTCVHLAILNEIELESLHLLMQKIDLKLLLELNDDGYTPLHIAVRTDSYLHAEIIMNTLDERLKTKPLFARSSGHTTKPITKHEFSKYYENMCKMLDQRYADNTTTTRNAQPKLKKKLLDVGDRKSGNTALFFAVENKLEHFIFFLLAHLTDPRIMNFCGQDAKSYYSEFAKTLNLSLKVDNAMDSVVSFLGK